MTDYYPRPDSIPGKVLAALKQDRGYLTPTQIAERFDTLRNNISSNMAIAISSGALCKVGLGIGRTAYCLPEDEETVRATLLALDAGPTPRAKVEAAADADPPAEPGPEDALHIAHWSDGDVVIYGAHVQEPHEGIPGVLLTAAQAQQLVRHLTRPAVEVRA